MTLRPDAGADAASSKRVARNFLALGSGEAVARVIAFGVVMYLARVVGPEGYGVVVLAMGINLYLTKIADFGVETAGTRAISDDPAAVERLGSAVLTLRLVLASVLLAVAALASLLFLPDPESYILALFALTLLPVAGSSRWIHMGLEDARPVGAARVVAETGVLVATVVWVTGAERLWVVPLIQVGGELLVSVVLLAELVRRGYRFLPRWDPSVAGPVLRAGAPLLIQTLLGLLIYNADVVFLRVLRDRATVGFYGAAYALVGFIANLGWAWGMSLLPALVRAAPDPAGQRALYARGVAQAFAMALPVAVGSALVAGEVIALGFGPGYGAAAAVLRLLAFAVPLMVLRHVAWFALVARGRGGTLTAIMGMAVLANFALNGSLIPRWGMMGAAAATVATELLIFVLMARRAALDGLGFPSVGRLWKPLLAAGAMALVLTAVPVSGLVPRVALGAGVFALAMTVSGGVVWRGGPALRV